MKLHCKERLASVIGEKCGVRVNPAAVFDVQVKRIHEYKRQQLNALYCIHRYKWIKSLSPQERENVVPRVSIFGGKAAPGYDMAKRIIRLVHRIAARVNSDPEVGELFKVVFLPNYNVSLAEVIVPASDISQHISTAGMEASGTSNMKFAMNGGSIIGTMDGANIEIAEECDRENLFIFGALTRDVAALREERRTRPPREYSAALRAVLADVAGGLYGPADDVGPLLNTLRWENDYYLVTHDFDDYCRAQSEVDRCFVDKVEWTRRSILCTAGMGKFSTDRTIDEYARDSGGIKPAPRAAPVREGGEGRGGEGGGCAGIKPLVCLLTHAHAHAHTTRAGHGRHGALALLSVARGPVGLLGGRARGRRRAQALSSDAHGCNPPNQIPF